MQEYQHILVYLENILYLCQIQILLLFHKKLKLKRTRKINKISKRKYYKGNGAVIRTSAEGKEKEIIEDIKCKINGKRLSKKSRWPQSTTTII